MSQLTQLAPILLMILVFWVFMIRPQQKKQKQQRLFIDGVKKGDDIATFSGIHGKVYSIEGDTFFLEVDKGVRIQMDKSSISMDASKRYASTNNPTSTDKK
ncbi:MAG: preprotein translocase subunit YajC [Chitinophagaceae bacterium]|nr:preprotein translocase subunit YajC [Chitinophagaceae bacterium]